MEEIKVGEYVRINNGDIRRIIRITEGKEKTIFGKYGLDKPYNNCYSVAKSKIIKHSPNIIDLIEAGDFVNGFEVDEFDDVEGNIYLGIPIYGDALMDCIDEFRPINTIDIKSIVTKEQFNNIEYKIGE